MRTCAKWVAGSAAAMMAVSASAENYVAKIYSIPPGGTSMETTGAGDNGLMSGSLRISPTQTQAIYRTNSGYKNLHPTGWSSSSIHDSWGGTYHCGSGRQTSNGAMHALFWVGGGSAVDIHPAGAEYDYSVAIGGGGQIQVGYVGDNIGCSQCGNPGGSHAGMWSRTAQSFSRLHSALYRDTSANSTDGANQVGDGLHSSSFQLHALMWSGPNSSSTVLHPGGGYNRSSAFAIWGNQQAGYAQGVATGSNAHAVLWTGSAGSMQDLHPSAFNDSQINAVRSGLQVGHGRPATTPSRVQAIAWHGSPLTWINLHAKLPYPFTLQWHSTAQGIDNQGNIVGYVQNIATEEMRPVIWVRQP